MIQSMTQVIDVCTVTSGSIPSVARRTHTSKAIYQVDARGKRVTVIQTFFTLIHSCTYTDTM